MLYNIALEYYNLALNELQQTNLYLFLACTLRDIGRTTNDSTSDRSIKCHYFDQALHYARLHGDTAIYLNILSYKLRYQPGDNEAEINKVNRHLCRELNYSRAASELCESFLSSETPDIDSALFYLKIFANDTSALAWSRDKYHLLDSRIKNLQGQNNIAYNELLKLYNSQTRQLAQDGKARTYTIARKYDLLLEHEKALERQIKLQHSHLVISLLVIALLVGGVLIYVIIMRNKEKERKNKQRIESLQSEVTHKRELLKNTLEQRLQLTKDLQNAELIEHKKRGEVPLWAKKFIEESLFSQQNQEDFLLQFNIISDNFLNHLQEEYPALTKVDTQIIALIITGLSISDICLLLNQTKNTIWSRRLRIKSHLNLTADDNLDEWLLNKYAASV